MRLSCLSTALPGLGKRKREAKQDNPRSCGDGEPKLKSKKLPYTKDMEQDDEGLSGNPEDVMGPHDAAVQGMKGPKVLRMDRGTFSGLDVEAKMELTKDLSAKEWNELIQKFWVEGEDNARLLFYTLNYDDGKRLEMFDKALTENLQYLFVTMCDLAYVPRTPKVMRLLEQGLEVYPELRHWILHTMYQLDYPVTRWHLDDSEEDLNLLQDLIKTESIKCKVIASHLAEIATLYPPKVLTFLLERNIITMDDVCAVKLYRKVWDRGGKEYLKWARDKCGLEPDQEHIDAAVSEGHEHLVDFIVEELGMRMLPSQKAVNKAAANGD